ncbi:hypothetical protein JOF53_000572 [Crossiella equi]|uniref:Uncharacterized protein n=1 Tax=Crossiella equi TaxID=130796 RepID=A0ABS5A7M1_9PSEU|nr:hypothetical protein [Crossiella equi]MBP2471700.1 hypothetical protein [Crossiella equi]
MTRAITTEGSVQAEIDLGRTGKARCRTNLTATHCELTQPDGPPVTYTFLPDATYVRFPDQSRPKDTKPWLNLTANPSPLSRPMSAVATRLHTLTDPRRLLPPDATITATAIQNTYDVTTQDGRRTTIHLDSANRPTKATHQDATTTFTSWGTPVEVAAPPKAEVGVLPDLPTTPR